MPLGSQEKTSLISRAHQRGFLFVLNSVPISEAFTLHHGLKCFRVSHFEGPSVPYTVGCTPAPLTFTIRPKFDWQNSLGIGWIVLILFMGWQKRHSLDFFSLGIFGFVLATGVLSLIRRERIEIYSERMVWRRTYFGITNSTEAPLDEVLGAEWKEGDEGRRGENRGPSYIEFFLPGASVKAGFSLTFDEFDRMREDIRTMFPQLIKRWGTSSVRSKDFTLLNLN